MRAVAHRGTGLDRPKDEILRPVGLYDLVAPDSESGFDLHRELLETVDLICDQSPQRAGSLPSQSVSERQ